jgi:hypothetical protein
MERQDREHRFGYSSMSMVWPGLRSVLLEETGGVR